MYLKNTLDFGHSQRLSLVILVSWDFELNLPGLYWELWTVNKVAPDSAAEAPPPTVAPCHGSVSLASFWARVQPSETWFQDECRVLIRWILFLSDVRINLVSVLDLCPPL